MKIVCKKFEKVENTSSCISRTVSEKKKAPVQSSVHSATLILSCTTTLICNEKGKVSSQLHVKLLGNASGNHIDTSQQLMHSDLYMEIWTRTKGGFQL